MWTPGFLLRLSLSESPRREQWIEKGKVGSAATSPSPFISHTARQRVRTKKAIETAITLKTKLADTQREIANVEKQMRAIVEDQIRLRANMERVLVISPPYQRYLKKLDEQETQIEAFQAQVKTLLGLNLE